MLSKPKSKTLAVVLAFASVISPISGFHKFYLGQPRWGLLYFLLSWMPIPRSASLVEAFWYLFQSQEQFDQNFNIQVAEKTSSGSANTSTIDLEQVGAIADALRQLDQLRQDGLMSEYEFEQKRRQLLDQIG
jgi:TM2 domain-containing membrane protein YozV